MIELQQFGIECIIDHKIGAGDVFEQDFILVDGQPDAIHRAGAVFFESLIDTDGNDVNRVGICNRSTVILQADVVGVRLHVGICLGCLQPGLVQDGLQRDHDGARPAGAPQAELAAFFKGDLARSIADTQRVVHVLLQSYAIIDGHAQGTVLDRLEDVPVDNPHSGIGVRQHRRAQAVGGHHEGDVPGDLAVVDVHIGVGLLQFGGRIAHRHHLAGALGALATFGRDTVLHLGGPGHAAGIGDGGVADLVAIGLARIAGRDGPGPGIIVMHQRAPGHKSFWANSVAILVLDHHGQAVAGILHALLAALLDPVGHHRARGGSQGIGVHDDGPLLGRAVFILAYNRSA